MVARSKSKAKWSLGAAKAGEVAVETNGGADGARQLRERKKVKNKTSKVTANKGHFTVLSSSDWNQSRRVLGTRAQECVLEHPSKTLLSVLSVP